MAVKTKHLEYYPGYYFFPLVAGAGSSTLGILAHVGLHPRHGPGLQVGCPQFRPAISSPSGFAENSFASTFSRKTSASDIFSPPCPKFYTP